MALPEHAPGAREPRWRGRPARGRLVLPEAPRAIEGLARLRSAAIASSRGGCTASELAPAAPRAAPGGRPRPAGRRARSATAASAASAARARLLGPSRSSASSAARSPAARARLGGGDRARRRLWRVARPSTRSRRAPSSALSARRPRALVPPSGRRHSLVADGARLAGDELGAQRTCGVRVVCTCSVRPRPRWLVLGDASARPPTPSARSRRARRSAASRTAACSPPPRPRWRRRPARAPSGALGLDHEVIVLGHERREGDLVADAFGDRRRMASRLRRIGAGRLRRARPRRPRACSTAVADVLGRVAPSLVRSPSAVGSDDRESADAARRRPPPRALAAPRRRRRRGRSTAPGPLRARWLSPSAARVAFGDGELLSRVASREPSRSSASRSSCRRGHASFRGLERGVEPLVAEHALQHLVALRRRGLQEVGEPVLREQHRATERVEVHAEQLLDPLAHRLLSRDRLERLPRRARRSRAARAGGLTLPSRRSARVARHTWPSTSKRSSTWHSSLSWWISDFVSRSNVGRLAVERERDRVEDRGLPGADRPDDARPGAGPASRTSTSSR